MISKDLLIQLYNKDKLSMMEIATKLDCSPNKVVYWMQKHDLARRSISDATYQHYNPNGEPYTLPVINTIEKANLYGLGIGLYWGEGTKADNHSIRLANTDPELLKIFMRFLIELYGIKRDDMHFQLQIFSDLDTELVLNYWIDQLSVNRSQFYKTIVTISGSLGTYRHKSQYGVVTVHYHNKHLRDILVESLPR